MCERLAFVVMANRTDVNVNYDASSQQLALFCVEPSFVFPGGASWTSIGCGCGLTEETLLEQLSGIRTCSSTYSYTNTYWCSSTYTCTGAAELQTCAVLNYLAKLNRIKNLLIDVSCSSKR